MLADVAKSEDAHSPSLRDFGRAGSNPAVSTKRGRSLMGEHLFCKQAIAGSSPAASTKCGDGLMVGRQSSKLNMPVQFRLSAPRILFMLKDIGTSVMSGINQIYSRLKTSRRLISENLGNREFGSNLNTLIRVLPGVPNNVPVAQSGRAGTNRTITC